MGRPVALILALFAGAQAPPAAQPDGDPPPRRAIAGIRSLECASTVAYDALPDAPHRLQAV